LNGLVVVDSRREYESGIIQIGNNSIDKSCPEVKSCGIDTHNRRKKSSDMENVESQSDSESDESDKESRKRKQGGAKMGLKRNLPSREAKAKAANAATAPSKGKGRASNKGQSKMASLREGNQSALNVEHRDSTFVSLRVVRPIREGFGLQNSTRVLQNSTNTGSANTTTLSPMNSRYLQPLPLKNRGRVPPIKLDDFATVVNDLDGIVGLLLSDCEQDLLRAAIGWELAERKATW